ncbi:unnamed protein product [Phytomonas sp. EM1]|nr:unnamed protein product [Phytomonas sp. EM1]|eukprot:CCW60366.1 unnamed protein product [Phytomonas sp. isolate EM1]
MQCLYSAELRAHVAVFVVGLDTVCACVPQACKEQRMRFHDRTIACMGVGREGEVEVTIIFDDHTVALCGVRSWVPTASEPATVIEGGNLPRPPARFSILKTGSLPDSSGTPRPVPIRVLWSGRQYMWIAYDNGSIGVFSCQDIGTEGCSEMNGGRDDLSASEDIEFTLMHFGRLACMDDVSVAMQGLFLFADSRVPSLYYCYTHEDKCLLHYGSIQLHCQVRGDKTQQTNAIKKCRVVPFEDIVYGLHVEGCQYHVLTQGRWGDSPLYLTTLSFSLAECDTAGVAPLYQQITHAPEDNLGEYCRTCEARIAAICQANANTLQNSESTASMLAQLTELQHSVYALLRREQSSTSVKLSLNHSYPQRILRQLSHTFMQVSVNLFLCRLDVLHGIEKPLHESLRLHTARAVAVDAQEALMKIVDAAFPSPSTSEPPKVELWPPRESLCVDVILEHLGYSSEASLVVILREATEILPMLALLILYYTYQNTLCDEGSDSHDIVIPTLEHQRQENALREEFLISCCRLPALLNTWAFACYAVDHGINPLDKSHTGAPLYMLGPRICHLSNPPVLRLLPALMNGLLNVAAVDAVYKQTAAVLGLLNSTSLPPSLALKLSFVSLKTHAHRILEAMYRANRHTVNENVSIHALALAALQLGDVIPLRSLIRVGSAQERAVERVLCSCRDATRRNWLRLRFYILMRRYADALQVCCEFTSQNPVAGQLTQMIASYLRSLMPMGNEQYMSEYLQYLGPMSPSHLQSNEEEKDQEPRRVYEDSGDKGNELTCVGMVPTSLENQQDELDAQVRCAIARCASHSNRRALKFSCLTSLSRSKSSGEVVLRPSTILSFLDQSDNSLFTAPNQQKKLDIDKEADEETSSGNGKCAVFSSATESQDSQDPSDNSRRNEQQEKQTKHNNGCAPTMLNTSLCGFGDAVLCEARLQRSGKMCNRVRPCPYHDRKG